MREIKFKGKRIDNSEWVIGDLTRYSEEMSYITVDLVEGEVYQVHTNSVGQFTGLKDRNGVDVYEGDIVECYDATYVSGIQRVTFLHGAFGIESDMCWEPFTDIYGEGVVIGNIHTAIDNTKKEV